MVTRKTDAEAIVRAALKLYRTKGYSQTSMADVGRACGLLKGSLYHYFAGKNDLALAVLGHVTRRFEVEVFSHAYREELTPAQRLRAMMEATERYLAEGEGGCVINTLAVELGRQDDIRLLIRGHLNAWVAALAHILGSAYGEEESRELAQDVVSRVLGSVVFDAVEAGQGGPLKRATKMVMKLLPEDN